MQHTTLIKNFGLLTAGTLLSLSAAAHASDNLVTVEWLKENLDNPKVVVLDASPTQSYEAKHIPGAHSVSFTPEQSVSQNVRVSYGGGVDFFTDSVGTPYPFQERPTAEMQELPELGGI